MNLIRMAWRNVWRNHRRSAITISAMVIALVGELLYGGLVAGMLSGMEDDATEMELGDVQVFREGYLTRPSLYDVVPDTERLVAALESDGFAVTARLLSGGLAASGDASSGAMFVGVDPVRDARALSLHRAVAQGAWLSADAPSGVVIGQGLSRTLGAGLGDEILVMSQAADGSIANELFAVRGILMRVAASMDRSAILMTDGAFRELMALPEGAHKLIVRRTGEQPLEEATAAVVAHASTVAVPAGEPGVDVMSWKEISPFLATYMQSASSVIVIVYVIVYIAVAILILNAMLMAVFERVREFGVLKAIGFSPWQVMWMMVVEGLFQAVIATAVGVVLAVPGAWYLSTVGIDVGVLGGVQMAGLTMPAVWLAEFSAQSVLVPVVMLFVIVLIAVLIPAWKAAWISPVDAMHHE